jgi:hypothetical protein
MKLKEVIVFLQEKLFAVVKAGKHDHTHRFDFSIREGQTSLDNQHYHAYRLGDKMTRGTMRVPPNADIQDHEHELPYLPHIEDSVAENRETLSEGVNPRKLALNLTAVFKVLKGNSSTTRDAVLDTFGILDEKNRRVVSTWVLDLLGASRRATGTAASSEGVREGQEASSAGIVAFDLLDVIGELARNKAATSKAVKDSFRGLSSKERSTISNWVAAMVSIVTPKG